MHPVGLHVTRHHHDAPGPPVVLVHGAPDRSKNFARLVHRLSDLPVTVYDRRGYGRSTAAGAQGGGFDVHAADLIDLLDGTPSVVVGQSAGGASVLKAATMAPELFLAIGTWEPPLTPWPWWAESMRVQTQGWAEAPDPEELGERVNRHMLSDAVWERLPDSTKTMLRAEGAAFRADMASQSEEWFSIDDLVIPRVMGWGDWVAEDSDFYGVSERSAKETGSIPLFIKGAIHTAHHQQPELWEILVRTTLSLAAEASIQEG